MSARYDTEAAEPNAHQLHKRVELPPVSPDSAAVRPLSCAGLHSTGWVV